MRILLLAGCLLAATACAEKSPTAPTVPLNERFTLAPGETVSVDNAGFRIQFLRVSGDSRCPADVVCIQGGDALVHIRVPGEVDTVEYELHTGDTSRASVAHGAARIELLELQPYPFSSKTIAPEDYRATLRVTRP
jgi:hypothetical protein